ncbi:MAG: flagellar motor protein MotB, partial [Candidatus Azotimanducaceae bacterium]
MIGQLEKNEISAPQRDRWLLSYADLLTLLLAFFVVMYSVSVVNEKKLHKLANSIESVMIGDVDTVPEVLNVDTHGEGRGASLSTGLSSLIKLPNVDIKTQAGEWLEFTLASGFLFD